jgi:hypothetical protein
MKKLLLLLTMFLIYAGVSAQTNPTFNIVRQNGMKAISDSILTVQTSLIPLYDSAFNLGNDTLRWNKIYADTIDANVVDGPTYPDSSVLFVGSDGKPSTDSVHFLYDDVNHTLILATDSNKTVASFGVNLLDSTNWLSTDWTGDYNTGFTHTAGNTSELSRQIPGLVAGNTYLFSCDVTGLTTNPSSGIGDCVISIGNDFIVPAAYPHSTIYDNVTYSFIVTVTDTGRLKFVPASTFDGTISNITLQLLSSISSPITSYRDSLGNIATEMRITTPSENSFFMGKESGKYYQTSGGYNTQVGDGGLERLTIGKRNSSFGGLALEHNVKGGSNTGMGYAALWFNDGNANSGFGQFSQIANGTGDSNTSAGFGSGYHNLYGSNNVWLGAQTRGAAGHSQNNQVVIGYGAGFAQYSTIGNIFIGYRVGDEPVVTANKSIAIGYDIDLPSLSDSMQMTIGNLIFAKGGFGTSTTVGTGRVGIKNNDPVFDFDVAGSVGISITPASTNGTDSVLVKASTGQVMAMPFEQGTYSPTDSGSANLDDVTIDTAMYSRIGNIVTVAGAVTLDATTTATTTFFYMSLPIPPANWNTNRAGGTFNAYSVNEGGAILMGVPDRVIFQLFPADTGPNVYSYTFTYRIQ